MSTPNQESGGNPARARTVVVWFFVLALALRICVVVVVHDWADPEAWEYGDIAQNLLDGEGYSGSAWFVPEDEPTAFMAPAYVFVIYIFRAVFGTAGYALLQFVQCILGALTAVLVFRIARRVFGQRVAILAGLLAAVNPTHVYISSQIHPLVLICALLAGAVLLTQIAVEQRSMRWAVALGEVLGISLLTDPAIICFVPFAAAWSLFVQPRDRRKGLGLCLASLAVAVLVVAPWTVRNYRVFDRFILVKSPAGMALWTGNHEGATGTQVFVNERGEVVTHYAQELREELYPLGEPDAYNELGRRAVSHMAENPGYAAGFFLRKAVYYWWYPFRITCPQCHRKETTPLFHHPEKLVWALILALGIIGIVLRRKEIEQWAFLLAPMFCYTFLYALTSVGSNTRYRIPIELFVMVFAAVALSKILASVMPRLTSKMAGQFR